METANPKGTDKMRKGAQALSFVFSPIFIPILTFLYLFYYSFLKVIPGYYKISVLSIVLVFTLVLPFVAIFVYARLKKFPLQKPLESHQYYVVYAIFGLSYFFCLVAMQRSNIPWYMTGIVLAALLVLGVCALIKIRWPHLSVHMAGIGGVIGGIVSFSELFGYNPVWWLCGFILLAGLLGSARTLLKQHTLPQLLGGIAIGFCCTLLVLHPACNYLSRFLLA